MALAYTVTLLADHKGATAPRVSGDEYFVDAVIGKSIEVPTLDGMVRIKIAPGTQSGKVLRLRDKGIKNINQYNRGDQLIYVNIWTPKKISEEEKKLLMKLKDSSNFKPNPSKSDRSFFDKLRDFI